MIRIIAPEGKSLAWYLAMEEYVASTCCQESGVRSQESGVRNQESGVRNQESGVRSQFLEVSSQKSALKSLLPDDGFLFTWVAPPTVIFGRHQVMENEVNVPYCKEHGIAMVRRKSGGGCVYADRGNLMVSYIKPLPCQQPQPLPLRHVEEKPISCPLHQQEERPLLPPLHQGEERNREPGVQKVFQEYLDMIADALRELGVDAVKTEHNDILAGNKKVSGNACYVVRNQQSAVSGQESGVRSQETGDKNQESLVESRKPNDSPQQIQPSTFTLQPQRVCVVHGTLLYDVDFCQLETAITPTTEKLAKHGVESVRQRVTNLKPLIHGHGINSTEDLADFITSRLCHSTRQLTDLDIAQIDKLTKQSQQND